MGGKHAFIAFENGNEFTYARAGDPAAGAAGFEKGRVAKVVLDRAWISHNRNTVGGHSHNNTVKPVEESYGADAIIYSDTYSLIYKIIQAALK